MKFWILTLVMAHGRTIYGTRFEDKKACDEIGRGLILKFKKVGYTCKLKNV
jgi:hypothetical protein